jgi:hypothetical protein
MVVPIALAMVVAQKIFIDKRWSSWRRSAGAASPRRHNRDCAF